MLRALRAKAGWPRAVGLVVLLAFALGLAHTHTGPSLDTTDTVALAIDADHSPDGHGHDGPEGPSASESCVFCAVVAGKFFLPPAQSRSLLVRAETVVVVAEFSPLTSLAAADLFRPPIAIA